VIATPAGAGPSAEDPDAMAAAAAPLAATAGLRLRLTVLLAVVVFGAVLALGGAAVQAFQRAVAPEMDKRVRLIGVVLRAEMQRALELGIGLDAVAGLDRYLADTLESFDEIAFIAVHAADGRVVARSDRADAAPPRRGGGDVNAAGPGVASTTLPILDGNRLYGSIAIGIRPGFVQTRLRDILFDVMTLGGVATLLALEGVLAVTAFSAGAPLRRLQWLLRAQAAGDFREQLPGPAPGGIGRALARLNDHAADLAERLGRLPAGLREALRPRLSALVAAGPPRVRRLADVGDVRLALLLFSTASEVTVAFLPVYTRELARPAWLAPEWAAAAPLLSYLLTMLVLSPHAGRLVDRLGARRLFLLSVPPTLLALGGLAMASQVAEVIAWRAVMAVFYGTATVACQVYAVRAAGPAAAARPGASFVAVVHGGVFCGSVVGGVTAGRFGIEAALLVGAVVAALAGLVAALAMRGDLAAPSGDGHTPSDADPVQAQPVTPSPPPTALSRLLIGIAVPMSAATVVVVWYLTPLTLKAAGWGAAETARVVMLYYLAIVLLAPSAARLADGRLGQRGTLLLGAALAAAALGAMAAGGGLWTTVGAMAGLGIGHALLRATLLASAMQLAPPARDGAGALRVNERLGALAGLAATALALPAASPRAVLATLAAGTLAGLVLYAWGSRGTAAPQPLALRP